MAEAPLNGAGAGFFARVLFLKTTLARLLLLLIVLGGALAYSTRIKEAMPDLAIASARITTTWPGGDAQTIEQGVTRPLEQDLRTVKGVETILSGSFSGYSVISVQFQPDVDPQDAMARLQTQVSQAGAKLPKEANAPQVRQASVNNRPIYSIRLYGPQSLAEISRLAERLQKRIENADGVDNATISGNLESIVDVRLIGARLYALGISPVRVANAIQGANIDAPWGQFDGEDLGATFRLVGRYRSLDRLRDLPVKRLANGRVVRLRELAEVEMTTMPERTRTFVAHGGGEFRRSVGLSVTKRSGADTIAIVDSIESLLAEQRALPTWPAGLEYSVVVDAAEQIGSDLFAVFTSGWQAMLAVFVVLMASLTWREAVVAGIAIPVAFAGGLILIAALGYSLNKMVIVGMVIALGLLVDVFILMMEGVHENVFVRKRSFGDAALATARAYAGPAFAGQLTTILAMAPLLGIAGILGKFIRPIPVTVIACLIAAYVVALGIAISLSRYVLPRPGTEVSPTTVDNLTRNASAWLRGMVSRGFLRSRRRALAWVLGTVAVFLAASLLFASLPTELATKDDGRNLGILVELEPDTSLASSQRCADSVGEVLTGLPYLESVTKYVGEKSPFSVTSLADQLTPTKGLHFVGFTAVFVPLGERDRLGYEYVPELTRTIRPALMDCPGGTLLMTPSVGGASAEAPVQIELTGTDMGRLRDHADELVAVLRDLPGTHNVRHNLGSPALDMKATPDLEALNFHGIAPAELAAQVRFMMANDPVGTFIVGDNEEDIDIRMSYGWPSRRGKVGGPTQIGETYMMHVVAPDGSSVPLNSLVRLELREASSNILRVDGERTVTVLADTQDRTAGEVNADIVPVLEAWRDDWPAGYDFVVAGEAESGAEVFGSAQVMLILALVLVFAILVLQFDSFRQPLIIMSTIPLALTGTFFGFFAMQMPFSFMAMVGIIALVGIVVNDSIVMIETMNRHRDSGLGVREAAAQGGADRLRPILTTSATTIGGMIPLAFSGAMWLPLAVTIISGLLFATVLALFVVPCLYVLLTPQRPQEDAGR